MKIEVGKCYKVRNDESVKYVEITGVYDNTATYKFKGTVVLKDGHTYTNCYMSDGSYLDRGRESSQDLVEELKGEGMANLQLEVGKKYKVRNNDDIKYVEITGVYKGQYGYDFDGTVVFKSRPSSIDSYMSSGSYLDSGRKSSLDLVEEYYEDTKGEVNENRSW